MPPTARHAATNVGRRRSAGSNWLTPKAIPGHKTATHLAKLRSDPAYPAQSSASRDPDASSPLTHAQAVNWATQPETTIAAMTRAAAGTYGRAARCADSTTHDVSASP